MPAHTEEEKSTRELNVFRDFLQIRQLPNTDGMFEKRPEPEPDILYKHPNEGFIAFELIEVCDSNVARAVTFARKGNSVVNIRPRGPSYLAVEAKFTNHYVTTHPIELLCYTDQRLIDTDDMILPSMLPILERNASIFKRVWLRLEKLWVYENCTLARN